MTSKTCRKFCREALIDSFQVLSISFWNGNLTRPHRPKEWQHVGARNHYSPSFKFIFSINSDCCESCSRANTQTRRSRMPMHTCPSLDFIAQVLSCHWVMVQISLEIPSPFVAHIQAGPSAATPRGVHHRLLGEAKETGTCFPQEFATRPC
ncbi:hypothetical protein HETIRDRAFT_332624 [Heterobasidion irregulare TC 32-1]|uniref:Uncharacterized protein n=1 Tax=Heterobasidion irregulare (strain TC 32-1) TaxID=747525 RepID=W4JPC0_HETIT|nr:uncharacterized protein HETIRDRAFT_332624 [Heterobasidion irregulare TC 32-1]ETW74930.1 hypothetical protein HETIRDRAFT_332624 [Heterobasidion irregulare TC 32-1]